MPDLHLRVYIDKSELVHSDGRMEIFLEGSSSTEARQRYRKIESAFAGGYLEQQIELCKNEEASKLGFSLLSEEDVAILDRLAGSITSEVGRALVALTVMQLCVKAIEPTQSVRLHKGGGGSHNFSWKEGISMRSLDNRFITPTLRTYDLLRLNADGFMMTRSLAENYPYSMVYKAQIRGARNEWLQIVERIEAGAIQPEPALRYLLSQLLNRAEQFLRLADDMLGSLDQFLALASEQSIFQVIVDHIQQSDYAARLMEIAMHSLLQGLWELGVFAGGELVPLSQMRSANKKHGNIGDVEVMRDKQIVEAWDAKYGKSYLRDEIEELTDKLPKHPGVELVGFVTSGDPERLSELSPRIAEIEALYGVKLLIISFGKWVQTQFDRAVQEGIANAEDVAKRWLLNYGQSLAQKRLSIAPIDEPCQRWVETLKGTIEAARLRLL